MICLKRKRGDIKSKQNMKNSWNYAGNTIYLVILLNVVTHDFEVADLLPKPSHNSRMSWTSDPNSSLMSSNNVSNTNLNLYYNSMQDSMYISSPPISPERLMASNIIRNLSQEVPSPQIHIIHDQPSFDYDPEQFE
eukprot:NODE_138_length_17968_cov_0.291175.p9 type:complete len:136 gc:universal NODE_138_length_17968_cov_0.291175:14226-14633(+)